MQKLRKHEDLLANAVWHDEICVFKNRNFFSTDNDIFETALYTQSNYNVTALCQQDRRGVVSGLSNGSDFILWRHISCFYYFFRLLFTCRGVTVFCIKYLERAKQREILQNGPRKKLRRKTMYRKYLRLFVSKMRIFVSSEPKFDPYSLIFTIIKFFPRNNFKLPFFFLFSYLVMK